MTPENVAKMKSDVAALPAVPDDLVMEAHYVNGEPLVKNAEAQRVLKQAGGALVLIRDKDGRAFVGRPELIEGDEEHVHLTVWARIEDFSEVTSK